nr:PREDICTED: uncharacterized protein LOC106705846 [Latimeria chalumnae]XP_014351363.1 PREDICTED: uncharacterized protein LOC106705846 [Latimeria chalumnae]|eukprot:XP_014351362.1 PREDICTED: uncharacterized protein LOC106705846 [Latimeria chalumnae]
MAEERHAGVTYGLEAAPCVIDEGELWGTPGQVEAIEEPCFMNEDAQHKDEDFWKNTSSLLSEKMSFAADQVSDKEGFLQVAIEAHNGTLGRDARGSVRAPELQKTVLLYSGLNNVHGRRLGLKRKVTARYISSVKIPKRVVLDNSSKETGSDAIFSANREYERMDLSEEPYVTSKGINCGSCELNKACTKSMDSPQLVTEQPANFLSSPLAEDLEITDQIGFAPAFLGLEAPRVVPDIQIEEYVEVSAMDNLFHEETSIGCRSSVFSLGSDELGNQVVADWLPEE